MDRQWRVTVIGAGAIGGWVAGRLALAGHHVAAVGRSGALTEVTLIEEDGEQRIALDHPTGGPDLLLFGVKGSALVDAAVAARPMIRPSTLIVPMMNGVPWWFLPGKRLHSVDPSGIIAASLPIDQVLGCVVHGSASRDPAGRIVLKQADRLIIGETGGGLSERAASLAALFEGAGIRADQTDDVRRAIWYKLWGNATFNPLSALTHATSDQLLADSELRSFMLAGMRELATIGAAVGCPINESGEDRLAVAQRLGPFKTSMLQDVEAGRPIELGSLLGAPREIARELRIPTPVLDLLYAQIRLMSKNLGVL